MKYTNQHKLHPAIVGAAIASEGSNFPYEHDFSATQLLRPPRIEALTAYHRADIQVDVHDSMNAMFGSTFHKIMEEGSKQLPDPKFVEHPLVASIEVEGSEFLVGGIIDLIYGYAITDWKTCKTSKFIYNDFDEWEKQLNIYAWIARNNRFVIKSLSVVAFMLDWNRHVAGRRGIPSHNMPELTIPLWTKEKQEGFIRERILLHMDAIEQLPLCTDEERLAKPDKYALIKSGAKRASKLFDDFAEAKDTASYENEKAGREVYLVETRLGDPTFRCDKFPCPVRNMCDQYKELKKK